MAELTQEQIQQEAQAKKEFGEWGKTQGSIHLGEAGQARGEEPTRIADLAAAQEVAMVDKTQSKDAAVKREQEMAKYPERTTLSDPQREFEKLMDILTFKEGKEINKYAFIDKTDNKGRRYRILHPIQPFPTDRDEYNSFRGDVVFFSRDGVFRMSTTRVQEYFPGLESMEEIPNIIDWTAVGDELGPGVVSKNIDLRVKKGAAEMVLPSWLNQLDIKDEGTKRSVAKAIEISERRGVDLKKASETKVPKAEEMASGLV